MNVTLKQLKVFSAVFELRNFTSAAEALHTTQSAVSKVCAELEDEVGFPLFERTTRRVVPCDGAAELYAYAQQVLGTMRTAERSMAGLRALERGEVNISSSPMMMYGLLTPVIRQFAATYPGVRFNLFEMSTQETIDFVKSGRGDCGLVSYSGDDPLLAARVVLSEPMVLACRRDHPLAASRSIAWTELADHPHITLQSVYSVRRTIDRILQEHGLCLRSTIQAGTLMTALGMVQEGLGVSLMPSYAIGFARQLGLVAVAVGEPPERHAVSLLTRAGAIPSLAAAAFMQALEAVLAGRGPTGIDSKTR